MSTLLPRRARTASVCERIKVSETNKQTNKQSYIHIPWQILVNKSNKSDHPHQREPWCFVEVVNKVEAEAMPNKSKVLGSHTVPEQQSDLV